MDLGVDIALILLVVGVLLLLAEAALPGAFLLVPGTVLIVLGGIGLVAPNFLLSWYSPLAAVAVLVPMTLLAIKLYQRLSPIAPPTTTSATSLIGQDGVVIETVNSHDLKGKVRIGSDTWSAIADTTIPIGAKVRVKNSEGVHVEVEVIKIKEDGSVKSADS